MLPIISIISVFLFGSIAYIFFTKEKQAKKELIEHERINKQKVFEISILKEIQDRIGYELDVEKIIDVVTGSLHSLFPYSTVSSLFSKEEKLVFKTFLEEEVNQNFIDQVKKGMLASLQAINEHSLPSQTEDIITGGLVNNAKTDPLASFFHIPLIINESAIGLISVSSTKPGLYKEDEMTILYHIVGQASKAVTKLQNVLITEKGKLTAMIGSLTDGVFMVDTQSTLLVINSAAKKLLKIEKEKPTILDIISAMSQLNDFSSKISMAITENKAIKEKEVTIDEKTMQIFITPVSSERGVIGASILLQDITLEKNLARMKEEFTNIVVHELRAPLTSIRIASKLLTGENMDPEQSKLINMIHDQSKKLVENVSLLLDAAKVESGKFSIEKVPSDLNQTISQSLQTFGVTAQTKQIELITNLQNTLPQIPFDPTRIEQVINNLLSNSLKFTPIGGKITVTSRLENNHIIVSVADTGLGIPKDKQATLFNKFAQVANPSLDRITQKKGYTQSFLTPGTGLGLYITKAIVEAHNGTVSLESVEGKGTTMTFTLPV